MYKIKYTSMHQNHSLLHVNPIQYLKTSDMEETHQEGKRCAFNFITITHHNCTFNFLQLLNLPSDIPNDDMTLFSSMDFC